MPADVIALRHRYQQPDGPRVTRSQMAVTLRAAALQARGDIATGFRMLADQIEAKRPCTAAVGPIADIVKARLEREPGEEG